MMAGGLLVACPVLYPPPGDSGAVGARTERALPLPAQCLVLRPDLRLPLCSPDAVARPAPVEGRRRVHHRRVRPGRGVRPRARRDPQRRAAADRLSLSLRLRHADRRCRASSPGSCSREATDGELADPLGRDLPAARRARCSSRCCARTRPACAMRGGSRCGPRSSPSRSRSFSSGASIPPRPTSSSSSGAPGSAAPSPTHMGVDGISLPFVILTTALMPISILASWEAIQSRVRGIHDRLPRARDADGRNVLRPRPGAVLSVLRGRPDPDVPDHRRMGRPAPGLCQLQVLPLHVRRLGADAARHHGDLLGRRHDRHPGAVAACVSAHRCRSGPGSRSSPRSR